MFLRMNVGLIGFLNLFWLNRALEHLRNVDFSQTDSADSNMELNPLSAHAELCVVMRGSKK